MADGGAGEAPPAPAGKVATFFAPARKQPKGLVKKRLAAEEAGDDDDGGGIVRKDKAMKKGLDFSTRQIEKAGPASVRADLAYASDRQVQAAGDGGATAGIQTETDFATDARAIREKVLAQATGGGAPTDDGLYHGQAALIDYRAGFRREHNVGAEKARGNHGPLRAPTNVRYTFRMDYQADVCKDYKDTGFCGFGDSCKFLHDRGDYKAGWQLDKDWEEQQKLKRERERAGVEDEEPAAEDESALPDECGICGGDLATGGADAVITRCRHYFCEHCALRHHARDKTCATCKQSTGGVFNAAAAAVRRARQQRAAGEGEARGGGGGGDRGGWVAVEDGARQE